MVEQELPTGLVPLREPTLYILLALSREPKHGYAILKDVEALSEGRVVLSTGTLYGALARLLEQGVVEVTGVESVYAYRAGGEGEKRGGRERKTYQLTRTGQRVLEAELARLGKILAAARRQFGEEGA